MNYNQSMYLYASDFTRGTYPIHETATYMIMQDIVFDYNAPDYNADPDYIANSLDKSIGHILVSKTKMKIIQVLINGEMNIICIFLEIVHWIIHCKWMNDTFSNNHFGHTFNLEIVILFQLKDHHR